jgi:hypothetical protein
MVKITKKQARELGKLFNIDFKKIKFDQWHTGLNIELEHGSEKGELTNITEDDVIQTARIVIAHLLEISDYYKRLKKMEKEGKAKAKKKKNITIFKKD